MAEPVALDERGSSFAGGAPSDGDETGAEELLTRVPLFEGLGRVELARLAAQLDLVEVDDGRAVVRQGEPGDTLYVVAGGSFGVFAAPSGEGGRSGWPPSAPVTCSARWPCSPKNGGRPRSAPKEVAGY